MTKIIALIDDDQNITTSVSMALKAEGFTVRTYNDGEAGLDGLLKSPPDLAILDIKMPRMDGLEVLRELRQYSQIPVIFLTSKDAELDELTGLKEGADDYITKPFSQSLLLARIQTLLRRISATAENTEEETRQIGSLSLDNARHICTWQGTEINLSVTEYLLLHTLAERPGHVKSRDQLIDLAYGESIYIDDRTIDSHIKRVRQKFKRIDPEFNQIETIYGIGYKYKEEEEE